MNSLKAYDELIPLLDEYSALHSFFERTSKTDGLTITTDSRYVLELSPGSFTLASLLSWSSFLKPDFHLAIRKRLQTIVSNPSGNSNLDTLLSNILSLAQPSSFSSNYPAIRSGIILHKACLLASQYCAVDPERISSYSNAQGLAALVACHASKGALPLAFLKTALGFKSHKAASLAISQTVHELFTSRNYRFYCNAMCQELNASRFIPYVTSVPKIVTVRRSISTTPSLPS